MRKKLRIFVFNSSPREKSISKIFVDELKEMLEANFDVTFYIYSCSAKCNLHFSDGSGREFLTQKTLFSDDMIEIENELVSSDIIILATPIYGGAINAQMKLLIDRLSYWMHLYRLVGKYGIVISASSSNANYKVNQYLEEVLSYLGVYTIDRVSLFEQTAHIKEYMKKRATLCIDLLESLVGEDVTFDQSVEVNFQAMKQYICTRNASSAERLYWEKEGYITCSSLSELHQRMKVGV